MAVVVGVVAVERSHCLVAMAEVHHVHRHRGRWGVVRGRDPGVPRVRPCGDCHHLRET